jgi:hypothetical protein
VRGYHRAAGVTYRRAGHAFTEWFRTRGIELRWIQPGNRDRNAKQWSIEMRIVITEVTDDDAVAWLEFVKLLHRRATPGERRF